MSGAQSPSDGFVVAWVVRAEHAVTGEPLAPLDLEFDGPQWSGWTVLHRRGACVLATSALRADDAPQTTRVKVHFDDVQRRRHLASPEPAEASDEEQVPLECGADQEPRCQLEGSGAEDPRGPLATLELDRSAEWPETIVLRPDPAPMTVEVLLREENGEPAVGAQVELLGSDGSTVPLTETQWTCVRSATAAPGLYRSCPPRVWGAPYYPFTLVVDGARVGSRTVDYSRPVTRHTMVVSRAHSSKA